LDKVSKHASSIKLITANNYINASHQENALPAIRIKIFLLNPLDQISLITGRDQLRYIIPSCLVTNTQMFLQQARK